MSKIIIPYHLILPTIVCIVGLGVILYYRKKLFSTDKWIWISVTVFLAIYFIIVGYATFIDIYCQWDLNRYDLDNNGFFSEIEITREQEAAMQRLTNDIGRNFSFITGFIFATVIATIVYLFGRAVGRNRR